MNRQIAQDIKISLIFSLIILFVVSLLTGCGSQPKQAAGVPVPNYIYATEVLATSPAAAPQIYPPSAQQPPQQPQQPSQQLPPVQQPVVMCPKCGAENALPQEFNYNIALRCSRCGIIFPLLETTVARNDGYEYGRKGKGMYQHGQKPYQGPAVLRRGYYSNNWYWRDNRYDNASTWNISPDGLSGSMSNTSTRVYEYYRIGDHGTYVGPGAFQRYGGY